MKRILTLSLLMLFTLIVAGFLGGCQTTQSGQPVFGHIIRTTNADGSVTEEIIPPSPEEIQAYINAAMTIAQQAADLYESLHKDDEVPSAKDQAKLQMQLAALNVFNTWLQKNGQNTIDWEAILKQKGVTQ